MAITGAHEHFTRTDLSAEHLHWASGEHPGGRGDPAAAAAALVTQGQPASHQWPYRHDTDDADPDYGPPSTVIGPFARRRADRHLASIDQLIDELRLGNWPVVGLRVTTAFAAAGADIVLPDGPGRARHAVLVVGAARATGSDLAPYVADGERLLCVRNSWGPGWGHDGHKLITENALSACLVLALAVDPR